MTDHNTILMTGHTTRQMPDHSTRLMTDYHVGQVGMSPLPDRLDMRSSKVPKDRPRFSSRRDHSPEAIHLRK